MPRGVGGTLIMAVVEGNHAGNSERIKTWIDRLRVRWVLGKKDAKRASRWSIIRDVLGWIE